MDVYRTALLILLAVYLQAESNVTMSEEPTVSATDHSSEKNSTPMMSSENVTSGSGESSEITNLEESFVLDEENSSGVAAEPKKISENSSDKQETLSEISTTDPEDSSEKSSAYQEISEISSEISTAEPEDSSEKSSANHYISSEMSTALPEESSEKTSANHEISSEKSSEISSEISTTEPEESSKKSSANQEISLELSTTEPEEISKNSSHNQEISSSEKSSVIFTTQLEESSEQLSANQEISTEISSEKTSSVQETPSEEPEESSEISSTREKWSKLTTKYPGDSSGPPSGGSKESTEESLEDDVQDQTGSKKSTMTERPPTASTSDQDLVSKIEMTSVEELLERATNSTPSKTTGSEMPMTTPQTLSNASSQQVSADGIYVHILGRSGKIVMGRTPNPNHDPRRLTVTFDSIQETDARGNAVGTSGRNKHSFNNFASQRFTFDDLTDDRYQNLRTTRVDFRADLEGVGATLTVQMYLFREEGSVTQGEEISRVSRGTLKFNIVIQNWTFCGSGEEECRRGRVSQRGEFIDLTMSIKGSKPFKDMEPTRTSAQEFDMGHRTSLVLSRQVRYDESPVYEKLPAGFPQKTQKGSNQLFVFRFRRFSKIVFYDPLLNMEADESSDKGESPATTLAGARQPGINTNPLSTTTLTALPSKLPTTTTLVKSSQTPPDLREINSTFNETSLTPTTMATAESTTTSSTTQTTTPGNLSTSPDLNHVMTTSASTNAHSGETAELSENGVFVHTMGRSGKIVMGRTPNPNHDPRRLTVTFDSIQETDVRGNAVGTSGRNKHSFHNFASQRFTFDDLTDDRYQSLRTTRVDFRADLEGVGATLTLQMYLFREEGSVIQGEEISRVSRGTLKFNIVIQNWTFCGSGGEECRRGRVSQRGEFIDLTMSIKGLEHATGRIGSTRTSAQEFNMGGNASIILSEKVKYDESSTYEKLPTGFPKMIRRGTHELFLFRFKKFNRTVFYDPQLNINDNSIDDSPLVSPDAVPAPAEISTGTALLSAVGLSVRIHGKSGKMTIGYGDEPERDSGKVMVTFDAIREVTADGTEIGLSGGQAHGFNTFANLDFEFSTIKEDQYMNISSKRIDFSADLVTTGARLTVQVFVFTRAGEITIDGEKTRVSPGTVKFNVLVESWRFCGSAGVTCRKGNTEQRGEAIDLYISIKGKEEKQVRAGKRQTDGEEFDLGGQASLLLSKKIQRDGGDYETMPPGYPQLSPRGSQNLFILRFPRFNSSVLYDPMIVLSSTSDANSSTRRAPTLYHVLLFTLTFWSSTVFKTI